MRLFLNIFKIQFDYSGNYFMFNVYLASFLADVPTAAFGEFIYRIKP